MIKPIKRVLTEPSIEAIVPTTKARNKAHNRAHDSGHNRAQSRAHNTATIQHNRATIEAIGKPIVELTIDATIEGLLELMKNGLQ